MFESIKHFLKKNARVKQVLVVVVVALFIGGIFSVIHLNSGEEVSTQYGGIGQGWSTKALNQNTETQQEKRIPFTQFKEMVSNDQIDKVVIDLQASTFTAYNKEENKFITDNPKTQDFKEYLLNNNINVEEVSESSGFPGFMVPFMILPFIMILVMVLINRKSMAKASHTEMNASFTKKTEKEVKEAPDITFDDIAGSKTIKSDVQFLIKFLENPAAYKDIGARMPKGIIFYGPPGTGKTLNAKAIAGEAGVPFFKANGSDFTEMYVGVGAKRVRELFKDARGKAPCIIFIDEIDAIGRKRGGLEGNSERDQTLNALLGEIDGFSSKEEIIIIGATNRLDVLDDALIRPGRFDKQIAIPLPEYNDRLEILKLYTENKKLAPDIDIESIAKMTMGFSGAGLETLLNEAAIIAVNKEKEEIEFEDIDDAFYKICMKGVKQSTKNIDSEQIRLVAWHEAGHAMVSKLLTKKSIPKVTIVPSSSGAGGATFIIPDKMGLYTKKELKNDIKVSYAGRIAEHLLTKSEDLITTGASQDIKQATSYIIKMIKEFGMNDEFGMLYMDESPGMQEKIYEEARKVSREIYEETYDLIKENYDILEKLANRLIEKETIEENELNSIVLSTKKVGA